RVAAAHARQRARQGKRNALLAGHEIDLHCTRTDAADSLLRQAMTRFSWSARAYARVLKLARTIADLAGDAAVDTAHVGEAIQYRRGVKAD
ncbi:YifB family Mg chelatase-like AAA ATPase, partial [Ralstonia pseudosolanacearum]